MTPVYSLLDPQHFLAVAHIEATTPLEKELEARLAALYDNGADEWVELADENDSPTFVEEIRDLIVAMPLNIANATELLELVDSYNGHDVDQLRWKLEEYSDLKQLLQQHGLEDVQGLRDRIAELEGEEVECL